MQVEQPALIIGLGDDDEEVDGAVEGAVALNAAWPFTSAVSAPQQTFHEQDGVSTASFDDAYAGV